MAMNHRTEEFDVEDFRFLKIEMCSIVCKL